MTGAKLKVSIVGITGYTGTELLRILLAHPFVELAYLTSRQHDNEALAAVYPRLAALPAVQDIVVTNTDYATVAAESDVVFLCLPHMASQDVAAQFLGKTKLIDLSADFRLSDAETFKRYYHEDHKAPDLLDGTFVYGLPEINRTAIETAEAVANPGCYALLIQTLLLPFRGQIKQADVMAVSGTSGGGRSPRDPATHPVLAQDMNSYLINEHRHTPEITRTLGITAEQLNFLPTVGPYVRGIFASAFVQTDASLDITNGFFDGELFTHVVPEVHLNHVVSTNHCHVHYREGTGGTIIAQGALDNLLRGASGTAVQNMNLMCGLPETAGLDFTTPVYP
ncbi:MAG: N-acetyl-gamma-glutamyl-phosphate reductase [Rhodospirillales bacterium]|nr:N-acetyl-gamma-glutamyl-phosphate reductase [Rhodospirillales bacterium]